MSAVHGAGSVWNNGFTNQLNKPKYNQSLPDGDWVNTEIKTIQPQPEIEESGVPILVVAYCQEGKILLPLMYLAQTADYPTPLSKIKGLLLLEKEEFPKLCSESITLEQYLAGGGQAILNHDSDQCLTLELFIQPRLLTRLLLIVSNCWRLFLSLGINSFSVA